MGGVEGVLQVGLDYARTGDEAGMRQRHLVRASRRSRARPRSTRCSSARSWRGSAGGARSDGWERRVHSGPGLMMVGRTALSRSSRSNLPQRVPTRRTSHAATRSKSGPKRKQTRGRQGWAEPHRRSSWPGSRV
jgi:hypothetical protein